MAHTRQFKGSLYDAGGRKHTVEGLQHARHSPTPGALEVRKVGIRPTMQRIAGMEEIRYSDSLAHPFVVPDQVRGAVFTRKMDGTCVIFSPLHLPGGGVLVFPRSRGMLPIMDTRWRPLKTLLARALEGGLRERIERACVTQKATLVFELFGRDNRHTVDYDFDLRLELHTMVKGIGSVQPWSRLAQVAKAHDIPTVEVVDTYDKGYCTRDYVLESGRQLCERMEAENDPARGLYRHEGVILNLAVGDKGLQRKFKPPSMEEYHRTGRGGVTPIAVTHTLWKMVDDGREPELEALWDEMAKDYGHDAIFQEKDAIRHEFAKWVGLGYGALESTF